MSYQTEQLKQQLTNIVGTVNQVMYEVDNTAYNSQSRIQYLETRLATLEEFMKRAEPYIKMMELIDPKRES